MSKNTSQSGKERISEEILQDLSEEARNQLQKIIGVDYDLEEIKTKNQVQEIIEKYNKNKELAMIFTEYIDPAFLSGFSSDIKIQIATDLIESNNKAFEILTEDEKRSREFIENLMISFIKKGKTILDFYDFIDINYSKEAKNKIFNNIDTAAVFKDLTENIKENETKQHNILMQLQQNNNIFFDFLIGQNIVILRPDGHIILSNSFISDVIIRFHHNEISDIENYLEDLFGTFKNSPDFPMLRELIITEIENDFRYKNYLKIKQEEQKLNKKPDNNEEEIQDTEVNSNNNKNNENTDNKVKNFVNQSYSGGIDFGGGYMIYETAVEYKGEKINMPTNLLRQLNSQNIGSFMEFYGELKDLKLNFLWDKYSPEFFTLLSNHRIDIKEAMRSGKYNSVLFSTLKFIGKNIGITGKVKNKTGLINEYGDEETNTIQKDDFKSLESAKNAFKKIVDSNEINGENYSSPMYTPVEMVMIKLRLINPQIPYLNISKFH